MNYKFRLAIPQDIFPVYHLMTETMALMEHKEWFVPETLESLTAILNPQKGFLLLAIAVDTGELAGYFMILFPGNTEKNLGKEVNFSDEKLALTCHMESTVIHPNHRGCHLQAQLAAAAEERISRLPYRYSFATVHPDNRYSLQNMQRIGYQIIKEAKLYGGLDRLILVKDLKPVSESE